MKTQPPLWILSRFGRPSSCTTRSHCPFGSMRKMRPKGISTHQRFPSRSNEGPSRKLSTAEPCRLGSDQAVRRFLRNFAGSEVKVRASMCLTFWNGYALRPRKKWTKDNSSLGGGAVLPSDAKPSVRAAANGSGRGRRSDRYFRRDVGDVRARRSSSRYRHRPPACASSISLFLHPLLDRVLDVLDLVDLDV